MNRFALHHVSTAVTAAIAVIAAGACTDLEIIEADAQLVCNAPSDCPTGFVCRTDLQRCITDDLAAQPPIVADGGLTLTTDRVSQVVGFDRVEATLSFSRVPVLVTATLDGTIALTCAGADTVTATCAVDLAGLATDVELADGDYDVVINGSDAAGNVAVGRARITVDLTPPDIVAGSVTATYLPRPGNPLFTPSAMGPSTDALLQMAVTEVPSTAPVVSVDAAAGPVLTIDGARTSGLLVAARASVADDATFSALPDGPTTVLITLTDDVGNVGSVVVAGAFIIDATAPAAPDTTTPGRVVYARAPQGTRDFGALPRFRIDGFAGAAEPGAQVFITSASSFASGRLGDGAVGEGGDFVVDLAAVDLPRVFVHVVDGAGNIGPASRIHDVEWTASLGGRERGRSRSNPHALFVAGEFDDLSLEPHLGEEASNGAALVDGGSVVTTSRSRFVQDRVTGPRTPPRINASVLWHAARGQFMAFGGNESVFTRTSALHVLEGDTWALLEVQGDAPVPRDAGAVYDPIAERIVVVQDNGETWFFEDNAWRQDDGARPPVRRAAVVVWDERLRAPVRFGGTIDVQPFTPQNDLWIFEDETWRVLDDGAAGPPPRREPGVAFDRVENALVLWSGETTVGILRDLWTFGAAGWVQRQADIGRGGVGVAGYTDGAGRAAFIDGEVGFDDQTFETIFINRVQTFDSTTLIDGPTLPDIGARGSAVAFDPRGKRVVLLGGLSAPSIGGIPPRFHVLENGAWRTPSRPTGLQLGDDSNVAWDPVGERVLLQSGSITSGAAAFTLATQSWNGVAGSVIDDGSGPTPNGQIFFDGTRMVAPDGAGGLVRLQGTWQQGPALSAPVPTSGSGGVFHEALGGGIVFGGFDGGSVAANTRLVVGTTVTTVNTTTSPPARTGGHLTYDDRQERVILFGNRAGLQDTWVFEDGDWRELAAGVPAVEGPRLLFDRARGVPVLLGSGADTNGLTTFELRDDVWVRRDVIAPGGPRRFFNAAYDETRGVVFVHGGLIGGISQSDILTWDGGVSSHPAQLLVVDLGARDATDDVLSSVRIVGRLGARGFVRREIAGSSPAADPVAGARILAWGDTWEQVGDVDGDTIAPADIDIDVTDLARLERIAGRDRLIIAVTPRGTAGNALAAEVATERLEVVVTYREP